jgi:hypothetical protein
MIMMALWLVFLKRRKKFFVRDTHLFLQGFTEEVVSDICFKIKRKEKSRALWYIPVIPELGRWRQEDCESVNLCYIIRPTLTKILRGKKKKSKR